MNEREEYEAMQAFKAWASMGTNWALIDEKANAMLIWLAAVRWARKQIKEPNA